MPEDTQSSGRSGEDPTHWTTKSLWSVDGVDAEQAHVKMKDATFLLGQTFNHAGGLPSYDLLLHNSALNAESNADNLKQYTLVTVNSDNWTISDKGHSFAASSDSLKFFSNSIHHQHLMKILPNKYLVTEGVSIVSSSSNHSNLTELAIPEELRSEEAVFAGFDDHNKIVIWCSRTQSLVYADHI